MFAWVLSIGIVVRLRQAWFFENVERHRAPV